MYIVLFIVILIVVLACINKKPVQESQAISIPSIDSTGNKRRKELKYIKKYNIDFVDRATGLLEIGKIESGSLTLREKEYDDH